MNGEQLVEIDETFEVLLSDAQFDGVADATRVVIGDETGVGTIVNDDLATISIDDVTMDEGDSGLTNFVFTISSDLAASQLSERLKSLSVAISLKSLSVISIS